MKTHPISAALLLSASLVVARPHRGAAAAEPAPARFTFTEPHMGTRFRIVLYAPDESAAKAAAKAAFARIEALNGIMSDYQSNSELMQLCRKAGGDPVRVGDDLFAVLARSQEFAKLSDGAFDATLGPLTHLWRKTRKTQVLPTADELADARRRCGFDKMRLDEKARTVQLTVPGMQLDLGGIAKGYAADEALKTMRALGVTRALVAAGGDIALGDPPPDAPGWKIGIAPLEGRTEAPKQYLILHNAAVSTSGDSEQHVEIAGVRYSHIIDPKTGLGMLGQHSVTVVAPNGTTSDGMTKVVALSGPERGLELAEKAGVATLFIRKLDKGEEVFASKRWKTLDLKSE